MDDCEAQVNNFTAIVDSWIARYNVQVDRKLDGSYNVPHSAYVLSPHAALLACGLWTSWGFPLAEGRQRAGLRLAYAGQVLNAIPARDLQSGMRIGGDNSNHTFGPHFMGSLLHVVQDTSNGDPTSSQTQAFYANSLHSMRTQMLQRSRETYKKEFDIEVLIHTVVSSGMLRDATDLRGVFEHAVATVADDPTMRDHLLRLCKIKPYGKLWNACTAHPRLE